MSPPYDSTTAVELASAKIFIPDTVTSTWPWPRRLNQYYSKVTVESAAWFASFKAFNSARALDAFERIDSDLVSCLGYPIASKAHVRSACDVMRIFFVIDEYSDVSKPSDVREQKNVAMDALHNPHKPRPKGEWVGGEIVRQFWERTIQDASAQSQKRFIATFELYLESMVQQANDRNEHCIRDIESYIDVRRDTVAMKAVFALLELGLDIPDEVISHPTIEAMAIASMDMVFIDNDIASYNMEQARGDASHNMITIVMRDLDTDVNGAMLWVADLHMKTQKKFLEAMATVPKWGEPIDPQVREYCDGLGNWVRANYEWNFETERYLGTKGPEIQNKKWMPLMPKDCLKDSREIGPVHVDCSLL
ncbi:terpenoid synthase [Suillus subalutaceus]|uniref:terpenoid synthase n=1 Tax=Suillus subalutaceus TaxID=48586 RepID=UPI001B87611C|nr:terpenoid synthase [Suillus subalutaceus]KAG1856653.1 terpenoid synthase [Suillus subalutaceus]